MTEQNDPEIPEGLIRYISYADPGKRGIGRLAAHYITEETHKEIKAILERPGVIKG